MTTAALPISSPRHFNTAVVQQKLREYFASGAIQVWYIEMPARRIRVYRSADNEPLVLNGDGVLEGGSLLPGFSIEVNKLFPT